MSRILILCFLLNLILSGSSCKSRTVSHPNGDLPDWAIGPFIRPEGVNPIISPAETSFYCPMRKDSVKWKESDTFNPAAIVKDGKIVILYRAEDNSHPVLGRRTSRIGYADSEDGITMNFRNEPVLFPSEDACREFEWPGGCEDPRVAKTQEGMYLMLYTAWNHNIPRLAVATSFDLIHWEKHGLAFKDAYNGRFRNMASKSASVLTKIQNGEMIIEKINGKYFMYWGEHAIYAATSDDLINWTPVLDENRELREIAQPRMGYFDSSLTECGPPAVMTDDGIVLIYNGKNESNENRDPAYPSRTYCAGQILFDSKDPFKVLDRLDKPFFWPMAPFEKSGQYKDGVVFMEGLVLLKGKFYLYYGCADSRVAVAICEWSKKGV